MTAAVEQVVAGVETDINNNKWNDAIVRLTALCDWIASIDNSSTEGTVHYIPYLKWVSYIPCLLLKLFTYPVSTLALLV